MKFIVEVDDFWLDPEEDLAPSLRQHVINDVVMKINKSINEKVEDQITRKVSEMIEKSIYKKVQKAISNVIDSEQIPYNTKGYGNEKELLSIAEIIKRKFAKDSGWSSPDEKIKKLAEGFAKEMKDRYDLLFASQVVIKLNEQGLLKDGVAESLLEKA